MTWHDLYVQSSATHQNYLSAALQSQSITQLTRKIELQWSFTVVSSVMCLVPLRAAASTDMLGILVHQERYGGVAEGALGATLRQVTGCFWPSAWAKLDRSPPACADMPSATRSLGLLQEDFELVGIAHLPETIGGLRSQHGECHPH